MLRKWLGINDTEAEVQEQVQPPHKKQKWKEVYETNRQHSVISTTLIKKWEITYKWLDVTWADNMPNFNCKFCKQAGKHNSLTRGKLRLVLAGESS